MSEDLKPCPFCGGEARLVKRDGASLVYCTKCERGTGLCRGDAAVTMWNTRPAEDEKDKEIERLKAALNEIRTIGECTEMIEDVVARGMIRKIAFDALLYGNKLLGQDTNVPANAPDTNVGTMEKKEK